MSVNTPHYNLKKPDPIDFFNIADFNGNTDKIDAALAGKPDRVAEAVSGNLVAFGGSGLSDSGKKPGDFLPAGTTPGAIGAATTASVGTLTETVNTHLNDNQKHFTTAEKAKLSIALTKEDIVVSSTQPPAAAGRIWIKI